MKTALFPRHKLLPLAACVALLAISLPASAAANYYLTFDGVSGGDTSQKYKGAIDMLSFDWGISVAHSVSVGGSGGSTSKPVFTDFSWSQFLDSSTPTLTGLLWDGKHIKTAVADFTTLVGGTEQTYFKMSFSDVVLTSIDLTGTNGERVSVAGSFDYGKITLDSWAITDKGGLGAHTTASYDLSKGTGSVSALAATFAQGLAGPVVSAVPEPETYAMLLAGLGVLGSVARRRNKKSETTT